MNCEIADRSCFLSLLIFIFSGSYGSGDIHLTRILHNRRFDFAMVAFLDCLRQLMEYVKALDPAIEFPHS